MSISRRILGWVVALSCLSITAFARGPKEVPFGPTGILGTVSKSVIRVTKVEKGSPADGKVKKGDQVIGLADDTFKTNPRYEVASAIDVAETEAAGGRLTVLLKGNEKVELQLPVMGRYSKTAPYDCAKSDKIISQLAEALRKSGKAGQGATRSGILGLMATGQEKDFDAAATLIKAGNLTKVDPATVDDMLAGGKDMGYVGWYWGYNLIALGEYYLISRDESVLPAIETYALGLARGQDAGGLWGHRMATKGRGGRLPGYAQMNQPSLSNFMGMLFAQKCGIKDPVLDKAIEKTNAYFADHVDKGAFPYGVHGPQTRQFNNNGTSGSAALCMALMGNNEGARFFAKLSATSYDGLETGHASTFFNPLWTPLGANLAGPEVTQQFLKKTLWYHNGQRKWHGGYGDSRKEGPMAGVALLQYCLPRKALIITGREAEESIWLKGQEATDAIEMSKWDYKSMSADKLIDLAMHHPIPQVRRAAGGNLCARRDSLTPKWIAYLQKGTDAQKRVAIGQYGWWIKMEQKADRLDDIGAILRDASVAMDVRVAAAGSVAYFGESAYPYYMDMVKLILAEHPNDPFDLTSQSLGQYLNTLCKEPFGKGLVTDKDLFYQAARKLMNHKRQHARGPGVKMLADMPLEDFHRVADLVMHIIDNKDPTYHSYHSVQGSVGGAISILAHLNIKEGIKPLLHELDTNGKWGFKVRMLCATLPKYGGNAREALKQVQADPRFDGIQKGRFGGIWNKMVTTIEQDNHPVKLISLEDARKAGK